MLPGAPNTTIAEYWLIFKGSSSPKGGLHISATYPLSLNLFPTSPAVSYTHLTLPTNREV